MNGPEHCAVVIPCFNEGDSIRALIAEIHRFLPTVIVVDDGSTDDTARAATGAGAEVIRHPKNLGKGAALRTGLARARSKGFVRALTMDGDGQHAPADIPALLRAAGESGARLIVGNRLAQPRGMPWLRLLVNRWMSARLSRRAGCRLPDSQCGFRLIDLNAWAALRLETQHFEVESETLLAFRRAGHAVEFVPVQVIYRNGRSKINPVVDSWRWLRWWWQTGNQVRSLPAVVAGGVEPNFGSRPDPRGSHRPDEADGAGRPAALPVEFEGPLAPETRLRRLWPRLARLEQDARAEVK